MQKLQSDNTHYAQFEKLLTQLELTQVALNDLKAINEGIPIKYRRFKDNRNVFGLEQDVSLMSNGNLDKLERAVVDWICNHIGKNFIQQIKIRFETIDGKDVCAIDV